MPDIYKKGETVCYRKTPQERNELNYRQKTNRAYKLSRRLLYWFIALSVFTLFNSILIGVVLCRLVMEN